MGFHHSPIERQGQYRYDPSCLEQKGPARIFPYAGEDGTLRYLADKLRQTLLERGQLSQPWSLLLQQFEQGLKKLDQTWNQVATLLADWEIFQSGWFNWSLPPDEQFSASFVQGRRSMAEALLAAKKAVETASGAEQCTLAEQRQAQRSHFYRALEAHGRIRPVVCQIHEREQGLSDQEFVRQRLAGQNPMVIRRIQSAEQLAPYAWARQSYPLENGTAIDFVQATTEHRLFVADYPLLQHLTAADLQPGRYVGSPIAVFYRSDTGLEPVLIQLEPGNVVTPSWAGGNADDWMRSKLYVQTADVTHHELIDHLCDTHLAMEAFAIATPRQLPATHPVYQLLSPHLHFLLAINTRGNTILLGEGAAIDKLMAPTRAASISLINQAYRERSFQDYALPTNLKRRGLEPDCLPDFPYRDDAILLWEAISRYVTHYLQRYYQDDRAVQQDPYLQAWAAELGAPLSSRPRSEFPTAPDWVPKELLVHTGLDVESLPADARIPGFPVALTGQQGTLASLQQLIDVVTQVIFTCGPQHAAVNFSQFDYVGYVPNAPLALYSRPDRLTSIEDLLPPQQQDLEQMELAFALSGIRWGRLGSSDLIRFADAGDQKILAQFQAELIGIENKISARNRKRRQEQGVEYPYLLPSRIPNSINI